MAPAVSDGVVTVGTWREANTTMDAVLSALDQLRCSDRRGAVRTSFLTLVAVGGERVEIDGVFDAVHRLGPSQPSRVVVLRVVGGDDHRLDGRVGVYLRSRGGLCLGLDDIAIEVAGPARSHLDSLVGPLTIPDLPLVVWCWERLPPARSPLIGVADHLVVDSARAGGRERLSALARLARRVTVTDLSWLRLGHLRRRLGVALVVTDLAPSPGDVTTATVCGSDLDRAMLAGWLGDRLPGVDVHEVEPAGGETALTLSGAGAEVAVEARRDTVDATVRRGGEVWSSSISAPPPTTEGLLAEALTHLRPDPVFEAALAQAAGVPGG